MELTSPINENYQEEKSISTRILRKIGAFFVDIIETIVIALAIFVVVYLFFFQPHQVRGASMEPNFYDGEYILTDKISYRFKQPQRGDVIVFKSPKNPDVDYIKRIIGLPGESITITNGHIGINQYQLDEISYLPSDVKVNPGSFTTEDKSFKIPPNEYFVMGDNRPRSSDSREWGTVSKNDIIGKSLLCYWPINCIGFIPKVIYSFY